MVITMGKMIGILFKSVLLSFLLMILFSPSVSAEPFYRYVIQEFFYYCFALWLVFTVILLVYVYGDAERRDRNGIKWVFIIIVLNIIGVFIWIFVRPPLQKQPPPLVK